MQENILYIGPDYQNHRGGIGAVLEVYMKNISPFKFIPTYSNRPPWHRAYFFLRAIILLFYTLISDKSIEVVHLHSSSRGSFIRKSILMLVCKSFRKKTILHIHASEFHIFYKNAGVLKKYIQYIFRKTDTVICLSNKWKDFFMANFKIKELVIVNNVIEHVIERKRTRITRPVVNFLFLGNIGKRKGIFDLVEVLKKNEIEFEGRYRLAVAGNGEVEKFNHFVYSCGLEEHIRYEGWVGGAKKAQLLRECDIYILPSYNEGLPVSLLEALAYGKPIISTNVGGIPEVVIPGYNGWLFEAGDHFALEHTLKDVLKNKHLLKKYGANSLCISHNYTPEVVLESLDTVYKKLVTFNHSKIS